MEEKFLINDEMLKYILLQRTHYKTDKLYDVSSLYYQDVLNNFNDFSYIIPKNCKNVIDIGCGIGGINVIINKNFPGCNFHLVDRNGKDDNVYYGYKEEASKYNNLSLTRTFLIENGIKDEHIFTYDIEKNEWIDETNKFDLIMSILSWGFHYPISTYINKIIKLMNENSILVLDIRIKTKGIEELKEYFNNVNIIKRYQKFERVVCSL